MGVYFLSGRLIRTLADVQYGNRHLTSVEVIYNVISFMIAIIATIGFTVYAKRTLKDLGTTDGNSECSAVDNSSFELNNIALGKQNLSFVESVP